MQRSVRFGPALREVLHRGGECQALKKFCIGQQSDRLPSRVHRSKIVSRNRIAGTGNYSADPKPGMSGFGMVDPCPDLEWYISQQS